MENPSEARTREYRDYIEQFLKDHLSAFGEEPQKQLFDAMGYSLLAGGKRLRPIFAFEFCRMAGGDWKTAAPLAAAVEMIHTYSLIHDDLPAMDNDDYRRGRLTNHKVYGEAMAILAGDALLTDAFAHMCRVELPAGQVLRAVAEFARAAGSSGMVGGQEWDMLYTGLPPVSMAELRRMHAMKTGALLRASCVCGALLAGAADDVCERIGRYGAALGVAFQIADDILDVVSDTATLGKPAGSDAEQGKNTYPALVGLDESRRLAREQADAACAALAGFSGPEAEFLRALAEYTITRAA